MTEAEIYAAIKQYVLATSVPLDTFLEWVATNPDYDRTKANWYKAGKASEQLKTLPPPPPPVSISNLAQKVMFTAWRPEAALRCPAGWKIAVSADPSFDTAARAAAPRIKAAGHKLAVWGNQVQVGIARIQNFGSAIGADYLIYQGESASEYDSAIAANARVIVGNPNSWTQSQRDNANAKIAAGALSVIFETYTNEGAPWPIDSGAAGVNVASLCPGVGWGAHPYHLADYQLHMTPGTWATMCIYLAEDLNDQDWSLLP